MNILLNASNLRHGGGRTVALQLIKHVAPLRPEDKLFVLAPKDVAYEALTKLPNVTLLPVPDAFHLNWLQKLWYLHRVFPQWCNRLAIDKVISLGNVGIKAGRRPQLLYIQLPLLVYHESPAWKTMDMRSFLYSSLIDQFVALHMRYATSYAVQTEVMRARLTARFKLSEEKVHIIANAPIEEGPVQVTPLPLPMQPLKLLFLSRYYTHKHYECLPEVARILEERKVPVEITLTISADESPNAAQVLEAVEGSKHIRNIGPIALSQVGNVVREHHGIFLPSLMESFSGAYAEALFHRRLIFTSHYDFASELLGEAAFYFDPLKPEHIVSAMETVIANPSLIAEKLLAIEAVAEAAPRINEIAAVFSRLLDTFA